VTVTQTIHVGMADLVAVKVPSLLVTLGLGSCIGVVIYDPRNKVAGMAHIMLPDSRDAGAVPKPGKFADTAVPRLLQELSALGRCRQTSRPRSPEGLKCLTSPGKTAAFSRWGPEHRGHHEVVGPFQRPPGGRGHGGKQGAEHRI